MGIHTDVVTDQSKVLKYNSHFIPFRNRENNLLLPHLGVGLGTLVAFLSCPLFKATWPHFLIFSGLEYPLASPPV